MTTFTFGEKLIPAKFTTKNNGEYKIIAQIGLAIVAVKTSESDTGKSTVRIQTDTIVMENVLKSLKNRPAWGEVQKLTNLMRYLRITVKGENNLRLAIIDALSASTRATIKGIGYIEALNTMYPFGAVQSSIKSYDSQHEHDDESSATVKPESDGFKFDAPTEKSEHDLSVGCVCTVIYAHPKALMGMQMSHDYKDGAICTIKEIDNSDSNYLNCLIRMLDGCSQTILRSQLKKTEPSDGCEIKVGSTVISLKSYVLYGDKFVGRVGTVSEITDILGNKFAQVNFDEDETIVLPARDLCGLTEQNIYD